MKVFLFFFFREQLNKMEEHISIYGSEYPLKNYEK